MSKNGINYFPFESNTVFNKRVKLLFNEFDSHGPWIWFCLLNKIYSECGYYYDLTDKEEYDLFCSDVCKKQVSVVDEIVKGCIRRGLFDESVFNTFGILTSDRIQKNYIDATRDRRKKGSIIELEKSIWLIEIPAKEINFRLKTGNTKEFPGKNENSRENFEDSQENISQKRRKEKRREEKKINKPKAGFPDENPGTPKIDFLNTLLGIFQEEYKISRGFDYTIVNPGKEHQAIGKLLQAYRKKNPDKNTEHAAADIRKYFKDCLTIENTFDFDNMSPSYIVSKFNEIRSKIEAIRKGRKTPTPQPQQGARTIPQYGTPPPGLVKFRQECPTGSRWEYDGHIFTAKDDGLYNDTVVIHWDDVVYLNLKAYHG